MNYCHNDISSKDVIDNESCILVVGYISFRRLVFRICRVLNVVSSVFLHDDELKESRYRRRGTDTINVKN